ncbi:RAMP superfamily CRISPR-associated protein [Carboxydocella sp. ULO1]|uniref:RAMP superfamily CRISPR-associated protein n=1 Tax=Carboxydocella sp. ULO1 TaxID=1926599 RepID=UPI0009AE9FB9|nr:RAMP superfamily CRISPR-associated protein [Carboxydocella sp. ULO1]GAW27545.1 hypothetical protein ULO1_01150 [Carboxydocella sp. ULO1]
MLTLTFKIELRSNYHIGAGYGSGFNLDSALLREADGTPVLRGSTVAGLLRDGACRLLKLPSLAMLTENEIITRLFGSSAQVKRWRISSAWPVEKRAKDAKVVWRVRINPRTRRAEPHKLFSLEEGAAGQEFCFTVTCLRNDDNALDEAAFLVAAARNVRQLGRSRRRGLGECVIHLIDVDGVDEAKRPASQSWEEWFLTRFDQKWMRGNPAKPEEPANKADIKKVNTSRDRAVRIRVIIRLEEPLLIAQRASAGNQFYTRPFISGSVLQGALAGRASKLCNLAAPEIYHNFVYLFFRGGVSFPVLYPAFFRNNHLYPTIPAPLALWTCSVVPFQEENKGHGVYLAWESDSNKCVECGSRLETVGEFVNLKRTFSPQRSFEMHLRIDEKSQRAARGDLYGYNVLCNGQYFVGELLCAGKAAWECLQQMTDIAEKTPLTLWLGKGRQRGYGKVTAWLELLSDDCPQSWIQLPLEKRIDDPTQKITLTLLTDTIIGNMWGQQPTAFTKEWLEEALGLGPVDMHDVYARTRVVDGFNATLGLPRWRDLALVAGSVVLISLKNPPEDWRARMQQLETEGIGVRRNEGFGRIAFNHPVYEHSRYIEESAIRLDPKMWLESSYLDSDWETFMECWEDELEKHRDVLLGIKQQHEQKFNKYFGTIARWLYTHSDVSCEELIERLTAMDVHEKAFGQPDEALVEVIGEKEYGQRAKENYFINAGKEGIKTIREALEYLSKEDAYLHRCGVERLAEWLTMLVREEKGGVQ